MASFAKTQDDLAAHFGVTRSAVSYWRKQYPEFFRKSSRGYSIAKAEEGRQRFMVERDQAQSKEPEFEALRARKIGLECQKIQAWLENTRRNYVDVADIMRQLRGIVDQLWVVFDGLGEEMGPKVSGRTAADVEDALREAIDRRLNRACDWLAEQAKAKAAGTTAAA